MTDETLTTDGQQAPRPTGGGLAAVLAPEGVAAILAVIVVVVLLGSRLSAGGGVALATPSPEPDPRSDGDAGAGGRHRSDRPAPASVNAHLRDRSPVIVTKVGDASRSTLASSGSRSSRSRSNSTSVAIAARSGLDASPGGADVGHEVATFYATLRADQIDADQQHCQIASNVPATGRECAAAIAKTLESIPALDDRARGTPRGERPTLSVRRAVDVSPARARRPVPPWRRRRPWCRHRRPCRPRPRHRSRSRHRRHRSRHPFAHPGHPGPRLPSGRT